MAVAPRSLIPITHPLVGEITLPGSKSITNRALLIAACARGKCTLTGALKSDDTRYMADALGYMGALIEEPDLSTFIVTNHHGLHSADTPLFLGNAGTAMRFLTALAATLPGNTTLNGDSYMQKRPIRPLVDALRGAGVDITDTQGCPPVYLRGSSKWGEVLEIDPELSSQYVSALLMAGAMGTSPLEIRLASTHFGAKGYLFLTLDIMRHFGAEVRTTDQGFIVKPTSYQARELGIEPDVSTATYFWAAEKITAGRIATGIVPHASSQPDAASYAYMAAFPHLPARIDGAQMQDAVPTLAILAALSNGSVTFTNVGGLRVKECDRIKALCQGLKQIHAGLAEEGESHFTVHGNPHLFAPQGPVIINTFEDHRIAMAFTLLGLRVRGIGIDYPECVAKTFPGYWDALATLGVRWVSH